ncbi:DUF2868 domain-containing protein [soil metagenome]
MPAAAPYPLFEGISLSIALRDTAVHDAVITEAIELVEQAGPLEDAQAMREACAVHTGEARRIDARASHLGQRLGLQQELARGRQWAPWMLLGLVALVVVAGLSLAGGVVGNGDRRINVTIALVSLLGIHLLTLLLWLAGLALPTAGLPASFGRLWLALTVRVAGGRHGQAPLLLRAATGLLARARLLPWAFGFVSHAIWSLSFATVLASLLFALAFRNYTLSWETTILDPGFFVEGVRMLGWLPAKFGFPVPDAQAVLSAAPGAVPSPSLPALPAAGQREWALWLTGCIVVYGLLPRVLLMALCAAVWRIRKPALRPDLATPYYRRLAARFDAMAPARIVDADPGRVPTAVPPGLPPEGTQDLLVAVGFELPGEANWPPPMLASWATAASASVHLQRVDGSAAERRALLDRLANWRPRRVLVACRAASSPDRGTERFLRDVLALCGECRLWLLDTDDAGTRPSTAAAEAASQHGQALQVWHAWLSDTGLGPQRIRAGDTEAILEGWQPR